MIYPVHSWAYQSDSILLLNGVKITRAGERRGWYNVLTGTLVTNRQITPTRWETLELGRGERPELDNSLFILHTFWHITLVSTDKLKWNAHFEGIGIIHDDYYCRGKLLWRQIYWTIMKMGNIKFSCIVWDWNSYEAKCYEWWMFDDLVGF